MNRSSPNPRQTTSRQIQLRTPRPEVGRDPLSVRRGPKDSGARLPLYLAFKNIKPFVDEHLGDVHVEPLKYRTAAGNIAHGIRADIIPKICEVWLDARRAKVLGPRQEIIADRAEMLLRALARVGIIALVDEATGFQDARAKNALAKILERFIAKDLRRWVKTFPDDFYKEMYRLWGWEYPPKTKGNAHPQYVGKLTNFLIYDRLAPGVLEELRRQTPRDEKGRLKTKLHRRLSDDVGHPALRELLGGTVMAMKMSDTKEQFLTAMDRHFTRYGDTCPLNF